MVGGWVLLSLDLNDLARFVPGTCLSVLSVRPDGGACPSGCLCGPGGSPNPVCCRPPMPPPARPQPASQPESEPAIRPASRYLLDVQGLDDWMHGMDGSVASPRQWHGLESETWSRIGQMRNRLVCNINMSLPLSLSVYLSVCLSPCFVQIRFTFIGLQFTIYNLNN